MQLKESLNLAARKSVAMLDAQIRPGHRAKPPVIVNCATCHVLRSFPVFTSDSGVSMMTGPIATTFPTISMETIRKGNISSFGVIQLFQGG
jgi:hypothetical protein